MGERPGRVGGAWRIYVAIQKGSASCSKAPVFMPSTSSTRAFASARAAGAEKRLRTDAAVSLLPEPSPSLAAAHSTRFWQKVAVSGESTHCRGPKRGEGRSVRAGCMNESDFGGKGRGRGTAGQGHGRGRGTRAGPGRPLVLAALQLGRGRAAACARACAGRTVNVDVGTGPWPCIWPTAARRRIDYRYPELGLYSC